MRFGKPTPPSTASAESDLTDSHFPESDLPDEKLPGDIAKLLRSERQIAASAPARRRRLARRLDASLGVGALGVGVGGGLLGKAWLDAGEAAKPVIRGAGSIAGKKLLAALGILSLMGAALVLVARAPLESRRTEGSETAAVGAPAPIAMSAAMPASMPAAMPAAMPADEVPGAGSGRSAPTPVHDPSMAAPTRAPQVASSVTKTSIPPGSTVGSDEALARERSLLAGARAKLDARSPEEALALIATHVREFPDGRLREEREALAVEALRAKGDTSAADAASRQFSQRFPRSVLQDRVEQSAPVEPPN